MRCSTCIRTHSHRRAHSNASRRRPSDPCARNRPPTHLVDGGEVAAAGVGVDTAQRALGLCGCHCCCAGGVCSNEVSSAGLARAAQRVSSQTPLRVWCVVLRVLSSDEVEVGDRGVNCCRVAVSINAGCNCNSQQLSKWQATLCNKRVQLPSLSQITSTRYLQEHNSKRRNPFNSINVFFDQFLNQLKLIITSKLFYLHSLISLKYTCKYLYVIVTAINSIQVKYPSGIFLMKKMGGFV